MIQILNYEYKIIKPLCNLYQNTTVRTPKDAAIEFIYCNINELFIGGLKV